MKKNHTIIMILRTCLACLIVASWTLFSACQSQVDHINALCSDVKQASMLTDDCSEMAKKLSKLTPKFQKMISVEKPDNETAQRDYTEAVSHCLSAYLEISTGACGNHADVQNAMPKK